MWCVDIWRPTRNPQIKKMASIDVNKQVLSECIKKALPLNYLSTGGGDIVLNSEQRVAL